MTAYHHHAATRANGPLCPRSFQGAGKRSAMALTLPTSVRWAFEATRDSSLAPSIGKRDEKREVDSMAEDDGT
jgi:Arc/MetJ family transcription regulator